MCPLHNAFPRIFVSFVQMKGMDQMPKPQTTIPIWTKEIEIKDVSVHSEEFG